MSKATLQTLGLLAVVSGSIKTINTFRLAPTHDALVLYTISTVDELLKTFPYSGKERVLRAYIANKLAEYDRILNNLPKQKYSAPLCCAMAIHICLELERKIRDKKKLAVIEPIHEVLVALNDKLDPKGKFVKEFERAGELVELAYNLFEFECRKGELG